MAEAAISQPTRIAGTAISSGLPKIGAPDRPTGAFAALPPAVGRRFPTVPHRLVRWLDTALRRFHRVHEFTQRPDGLLRIAIGRARGDMRLADGSDVVREALVLDLHLWNEHLATMPSPSVGLGRANALRRQLRTSFCELADYIASEPSLGGIAALRARTALVPRARIPKLLRIARAYGFDTVEASRLDPLWRRSHDFWENFLIWSLAWTFNPAALRGGGLVRPRCELWASRDAFIARYGQRATDQRRGLATAPPSPPRYYLPDLRSRSPKGIASHHGYWGAMPGIAGCHDQLAFALTDGSGRVTKLVSPDLPSPRRIGVSMSRPPLNVRRFVIDVDKALKIPTLIEIAAAIHSCKGVQASNITVTEVDQETIGTNVTVEGENLCYDDIVRAIEHSGAVVHSLDQVVCGDKVLEYVPRAR